MEPENCWILCAVDDDYEINTTYPHQIRRASDHRIATESVNNGYVTVNLGRPYLKHRVVAIQWIPNPNNLPEVDHINHNRSDNCVENLRWCTRTENLRDRRIYNCQPIEYISSMPKEQIKFNSYNGYTFDQYVYSFDHDRMISLETNRFVALTPRSNDVLNITLKDVNGTSHFFSWKKLLSYVHNNRHRLELSVEDQKKLEEKELNEFCSLFDDE